MNAAVQAIREARAWQLAIGAVSLLALGVQIYLVARDWTFYQYDFRAYYSGPFLRSIGEDPYSVIAHLAWAESEGLHDHALAFVYSPLILFAFSPLAMLPYPVAFGVWLGLQVLALAYVCIATVRVLDVPAHWALPCLAFGLNGTLAAVLRSGQVTLIILVLMLSAVALLKRRSTGGALIPMVVAATLKIWVVPLLALAAVPFSTRRILLVAAAFGIIVVLTLSGTLFAPELQARYQEIVGEMVAFDRAPVSPYDQSILNILAYISDAGAFPTAVMRTVWLAVCAGLVGITAIVCLPLTLGTRDPARLYPLFFSVACLLLLLIVPRAIHYQWTIALPAAAYVLCRIRTPAIRGLLTAMLLIPPLYVNRYLFGISTDARLETLLLLPWGFWSYLTVSLLWVACLGIARRDRRDGLL